MIFHAPTWTLEKISGNLGTMRWRLSCVPGEGGSVLICIYSANPCGRNVSRRPGCVRPGVKTRQAGEAVWV